MKHGNDLTKVLISTGLITIIAVIAFFTYANINKRSDDPRVRTARILLKQYDISMKKAEFQNCHLLMDSALKIYRQFSDYRNSFEIGIVFNNKGSVFLTQALYVINDSTVKSDYLKFAEACFDSALTVYNQWLNEFKHLRNNKLQIKVREEMNSFKKQFIGKNIEKIVKKRVKEIEQAKIETPRRISVCWSNKGIVMRHTNRIEQAISCYKKAMELWPDNPVAKNNLNTLLGLPPEKTPFLKRLFPPDRF
ncbi:MAG: hypothetical protein GX437_00920 [Sphingobacteriales bacterium]|nr:hypothetical protein [Sphingobacteriales bacterium]